MKKFTNCDLEELSVNPLLFLEAASLPKDPKEVIGRKFHFEYSHDGEYVHHMWGTVLGMDISQEYGLFLYVSVPVGCGQYPVKWLEYILPQDEDDEREPGWQLETSDGREEGGRREWEGRLELL